jgi:hypothetical protein
MAYKIIWSLQARDDLREVLSWAGTFVRRIIDKQQSTNDWS